MTCIVVLIKNGDVYMGGDSFGGSSNSKNMYTRSKVFLKERFVVGYTSSFRMGQILEFDWEPPKQLNEDDYEYLVTKVVPSIQKIFKDKKYGTEKDGEQEGGAFLIGYNGKCYYVQNDFSVLEPQDGYDSVGSGYKLALGSLASTEDWDDPEQRIRKAIEVAEKYQPTVGGPINIKVLRKDE